VLTNNDDLTAGNAVPIGKDINGLTGTALELNESARSQEHDLTNRHLNAPNLRTDSQANIQEVLRGMPEGSCPGAVGDLMLCEGLCRSDSGDRLGGFKLCTRF
jgi:hypothetical protein